MTEISCHSITTPVMISSHYEAGQHKNEGMKPLIALCTKKLDSTKMEMWRYWLENIGMWVLADTRLRMLDSAGLEFLGNNTATYDTRQRIIASKNDG